MSWLSRFEFLLLIAFQPSRFVRRPQTREIHNAIHTTSMQKYMCTYMHIYYTCTYYAYVHICFVNGMADPGVTWKGHSLHFHLIHDKTKIRLGRIRYQHKNIVNSFPAKSKYVYRIVGYV